MVEGNGKSTLLGGATGKGWLPGQSGNPGGRPKGLTTFIREQTKDGQEIAEFLLSVMRGQDDRFFRPEHMLKAAEMLLDRGGWAKAPVVVEASNKPLPLLKKEDLTEDELREFERFGLVLAAIRDRVAGGTLQAPPQ